MEPYPENKDQARSHRHRHGCQPQNVSHDEKKTKQKQKQSSDYFSFTSGRTPLSVHSREERRGSKKELVNCKGRTEAKDNIMDI
ncbi:hypothetical protein PoB_007053600 [Plakobranchus ocellatus]|uniref:Uncharacterized protein n=1 Tax=Plakobranchus ocellatus TaxID=259542 RepID=A0AAV4DIQ4_9GAST|nr:hypothetical protein PoB_007053600 [Plakobranchus ocellatus]